MAAPAAATRDPSQAALLPAGRTGSSSSIPAVLEAVEAEGILAAVLAAAAHPGAADGSIAAGPGCSSGSGSGSVAAAPLSRLRSAGPAGLPAGSESALCTSCAVQSPAGVHRLC